MALQSEYHPSLILGDFNIDFLKRKFNTRHTIAITTCNALRLSRLMPSSGMNLSKLDAAFSSVCLGASLTILNCPFPTDHPMFVVSFPVLDELHINFNNRIRFNLRQLALPLIRGELCSRLNISSDFFISLFQNIHNFFRHATLTEKQSIIDESERLFVDSIQDDCAIVLGTFHGKPKPPTNLPHSQNLPSSRLSNCFQTCDAIRLFKNHLQSSSLSPSSLISSDPTNSVIQDVFDFYNAAYKPIVDSFAPGNIRELFTGIPDEDFINFITLSCVTDQISKLSSSKACGHDGIHAIILKECSSSRLSAAIYSLFKCCASLGVTPLRWNESIIFPIPKKSSSRHIQDYRPIALTNIFRRLFESILLKFIRSKLSMFFDLCPNQTGYSTITHAIVSNEIACSGSSLQFHVFLDLRKAYDSVPMVMLVNKLINRNIPSGIVSLLISLFTSCTTRILVNGELTNKIQLSRGLMQGAILAPFLFNIFIDDLASSLSSNWPNDPFPHSLFFADDIKLNHSSLEYLQDMPDICYRWSLDNGMEFNVLKSAFHNCPLLDNSNSTLSLGYSLLPGVDSYTYLGFPHTFKCINWKEHLKAASLKAHKLLQSLSDYQYLWNPGVKLTIFRTFI